MELEIRKIITTIEEIRFEGFKELEKPIKRVAVSAVIKNPFAGSYVEDLSPLMDVGEYLGSYLSEMAIKHLDGPVHSYGKAAIIGVDGELEHGAAILHPKLGKPMREVIGGGKAIIPSAKKAGGPGTCLDVPLHYKDAAFVRTHYDAMEVRVHDAPHADEIVVTLAFTDGGRPHPRIGGLVISEVAGEDGLR
ncbi:MAG TPA: amino acid synthesis family protein [Oscillospiraceae bacterium]|nr:amino acid synthesis family protein [Oscillospiraceae bacterium]